jgi:hypothetical protein
MKTAYEIAKIKSDDYPVTSEGKRKTRSSLKVSEFANKSCRKCWGSGVLGYDIDHGRKPIFCKCTDRKAFLEAVEELQSAH